MKVKRWHLASLQVAICAIMLVGGASTGASEDTVPLFDAPLVRANVQGSVNYLMTTYGISESEAMRRLELQRAAPVIEDLLREQEPDSYGGMWIDQEGGGKLVVAMTQPERLATVSRTVPDQANIYAVQVARSLKPLEAIHEQLVAHLGDPGPDSIDLPAIDERANQVVLFRRDWLPSVSNLALQAAADDGVTRALEDYPGAVSIRLLPKPKPLADPGSTPVTTTPPYADWGYCHPLHCSNYGPMRGGLQLDIQRDDGSWGGCTAGFNMSSYGGRKYNGWKWVLTAGHCVAREDTHSHIDYGSHNGVPVFREIRDTKLIHYDYPPYDFAVLPYYNSSYEDRWINNWSYRNRVLSTCRSKPYGNVSGATCQSTGDYLIHGYYAANRIKKGWIVCASGSGSSSEKEEDYQSAWDTGAGTGYWPGTRCGRVIGNTSRPIIKTDICARRGDSGGPLFNEIDYMAYGILVGAEQERSGPCKAGERNDYLSIEAIIAILNRDNPGENFVINTD
jgi:streptogrisin C